MQKPKYEAEVDFSNANTSHTQLIELVGSNKTVLDVGCATGYLAKAMAERGCSVSGLEIDAEAAAHAAPHLAKLVVGDLEHMDLAETFGAATFDVVVFGDVLEHLTDPLAALRKALPLLAPRGSVVVSIPNIAHGSVRLALLQGKFDYQPLGILDETHLRFFTLDSIEKLMRLAGLVPVDVRRTTTGLFEGHVSLDEREFPPELLDRVLADPEALTYQYVLRAIADDADGAVHELHLRDKAKGERIMELEGELASVRTETDALVRGLRDSVRQLDERVEHLTTELATARAAHEALMRTRTIRYSGPLRRGYALLRRTAGHDHPRSSARLSHQAPVPRDLQGR